MKKILPVFLFMTAIAFGNPSFAQDEVSHSDNLNYKTALGIRLSSSLPIVSNAITLKHFINDKAAVEGMFSFGDPLAIGALYEIHTPFSTPGLQWFYGAGGYLGFGKQYDVNKEQNVNTNFFGAQGIVGLDYKFASLPINLSLDWKPELNIVPDIHFEPAAIGFSARFTFNK